jgi:hypothetical protein
VVGCGNATMRLRTGDYLRVNGGQGTVEKVEGKSGHGEHFGSVPQFT